MWGTLLVWQTENIVTCKTFQIMSVYFGVRLVTCKQQNTEISVEYRLLCALWVLKQSLYYSMLTVVLNSKLNKSIWTLHALKKRKEKKKVCFGSLFFSLVSRPQLSGVTGACSCCFTPWLPLKCTQINNKVCCNILQVLVKKTVITQK